MTIRTRLSVLVALAAIGGAAPAFAQTTPAVPPDAGEALWCSSAFTIVEPQARAQGQGAAADNFDKYAKSLTTTAGSGLKSAGFTDDQIKAQTASYTDKVTKELNGNGSPEFSVVDCTKLVDPAAAAAIQSSGDAPAAAPTTPAAPPAATPAPAK